MCLIMLPSGCVNLTVAIVGRTLEPYATTASPSTVRLAAKMRCGSSAAPSPSAAAAATRTVHCAAVGSGGGSPGLGAGLVGSRHTHSRPVAVSP